MVAPAPRKGKLVERATTALAHTLAARGVSVGERFAKAAPEVVKKGSPEIRSGFEKAGNALIKELEETRKALLEAIEKHASPVSPETAAKLAGVLAGIGASGLVATSAAGAALEAASLGQLEIPGQSALRLAGYLGFGLMLGATVRVPYKWAVDIGHNYYWAHKMTPELPPLGQFFDAFSRFKISEDAFFDRMRWDGINPEGKLPTPMRWYTYESILANPLDPTKWTEYSIETWADMYRELAFSPVRYFELNAAARAGFYNRELFMRALQDSSYGPLAMAIVLSGVERAFLRRHLTSFENAFIDQYLSGEISEEQFREALEGLGYSRDQVELLVDFFRGRKRMKRRQLTLAMIRRAYQAGRLSWDEAEQELRLLGYGPEAIELIRADWDQEIRPDRELTKTDVLRLYKAGIWDEEQTRERLKRMGFEPDDIQALLELYAPEMPVEGGRRLTQGQLSMAFRYGVIDDLYYLGRLLDMGYSHEDAWILWQLDLRRKARKAREEEES